MKLILKCRDSRYGWMDGRACVGKNTFSALIIRGKMGPQLFVAVFQLLIEFNYAISDTGGGVKGLFME